MLPRLPLIKVVGVSASGKSTLVQSLRAAGYDAHPISQEHSGVGTLWKAFSVPQLLIYLDASLDCQQRRRPDVMWTADALAEEHRRLAGARAHADLVIDTSAMDAKDVAAIVLSLLQSRGLRHADGSLPPVNPTGSSHAPHV